MHLHPSIRAGLALALSLVHAQAQEPAPAPYPFALRVPIHGAADDPQGGSYGLWTAGPDYKASFHDGFEFVPLLGPSVPRNLPLHWRTRSVARGSIELCEGTPVPRHEAWRFERHWPAVTEAYDVRPEGVEQSFVLRSMPRNGADLVVTAELTTALRPAERAPGHAAVTFADDDGRAVVEYGAAIAFDAAGRITQVETGVEGSTLRLVVDGGWLDEAALPVTIDPLVRTVIADGSATSTFDCADIARDDEANQFLYVFSRSASAGDVDLIAGIGNAALNQFTVVFSDLSTSWRAERGRVAFVGGADRWAIAFQRFFLNSQAMRVRVHLHDKGNLILNSGRTLFLDPPSGQHDSSPAIGGVVGLGSGSSALVAYVKDFAPTAQDTGFSRVQAVLVDCAAERIGTPLGIGGDGQIDAQAPTVVRGDSGAAGVPWIVGWQEHSNAAGAPWRVLARQVFPDRSVTTHQFLGSNQGNHNVHPQIDGAGGRYLVAWLEQPNTRKTNSSVGFRIRARKFGWDAGAPTASKGAVEVVAEHPTLQRLTFGDSHAIAHDSDTKSHWLVAWTERERGLFAARLGFDARTAEAVELRLDPSGERSEHAGVCFDDDLEQFVVAYTTRAATSRVRIAQIDMPPAAVARFGTRCAGGVFASNLGEDLPYAGSESFAIRFTSGQPAAPSFLLASFAAAATPLPLPFSAGCVLSLDATQPLIVAGSGTTDANGSCRFPLPLPSPFDGDLLVQAVQLDAATIAASDALRLTVR